MRKGFRVRVVEPPIGAMFSIMCGHGLVITGPKESSNNVLGYFDIELENAISTDTVAGVVAPFLAGLGVKRVELFNQVVDVGIDQMRRALHSQPSEADGQRKARQ
jgi:hypothetical protein